MQAREVKPAAMRGGPSRPRASTGKPRSNGFAAATAAVVLELSPASAQNQYLQERRKTMLRNLDVLKSLNF
jgi:hypothetical protein